ncbi:YggS family pyridoxal phosphate-dependent enzyme [Lacihabitans sp. CCS-44]|uniref:YggS family pyridoxal phosphate-dependent enzyme n=1 Tax=Lacihabitans sp. CCS-44 TaxID=2487331 RepID=UPI0020CDF0AB|nr:YggS family pyridoxal phosphate-dependent enzyme [Lacihabitans sp. CCS-44]MCP9755733.1 YggS family pyridoxal phosphate-dependent enzyme [Lacihabitans sp. CCS-44]
MTEVQENITNLKSQIPSGVKLVAVSKFKPKELLLEAYEIGFSAFGENYVQELVDKYEVLPKDIQWHFIGHLQTNKVKYIAPFVHLIHSVDSFKLLKEIDKQAARNERVIECLIQIYIAKEDSKTGMDKAEYLEMLESQEFKSLKNVKVKGLMGMSTFTDNMNLVREEFRSLKDLFEQTRSLKVDNFSLEEISMGMSGDWQLAVEEGSTMIRVGSSIFGSRG